MNANLTQMNLGFNLRTVTLSASGERFIATISTSDLLWSHTNLRYSSIYYCRFDKSDEWDQAEELMSNYRTVLERRESLNSEVASMERRNIQLEEELKSKLKEKVNEELAFPPSSIISVGDGAK